MSQLNFTPVQVALGQGVTTDNLTEPQLREITLILGHAATVALMVNAHYESTAPWQVVLRNTDEGEFDEPKSMGGDLIAMNTEYAADLTDPDGYTSTIYINAYGTPFTYM